LQIFDRKSSLKEETLTAKERHKVREIKRGECGR